MEIISAACGIYSRLDSEFVLQVSFGLENVRIFVVIRMTVDTPCPTLVGRKSNEIIGAIRTGIEEDNRILRHEIFTKL
jgi:hypothetical protein